MKSFKVVQAVCRNNFRKWSTNYRVWCISILLLMTVHMFTEEIRIFVSTMDVKVTPWIFPFLCNQKYTKLLLFFPLIILYCDAPFIDPSQPYSIIRAGRKKWCMGQMLYIVISSAVYFLFIMFSSIIVNIPYMRFGLEWGKILNTLAKTNASAEIGLKIIVDAKIIDYFTPIQALFYTFLFLWLSGVFLGMLIFSLNTVTNTRSAGVFTAAGFMLFDATLNGRGILLWVSPVSWGKLTNIRIGENTNYPTTGYVYFAYIILFISFALISVLAFKKKTILSKKELW